MALTADGRQRWAWGLAAAVSLSSAAPVQAQTAAVQTICTITVNSADEKSSFARHLPARQFRWVELVEPGRRDWLTSACRTAPACDVLLISGHFDGQVFFSDRLESLEHLPVAELERASCSDSCPALFERLKEVYLFGCNTLNPRATASASSELLRRLVREDGATAERLLSQAAGSGESSLQRMRRIFPGVPVIYGFPSVAPLGPVAGMTLEAYFREHGPSEITRGRPGRQLLDHFASFGLQAVSGVREQGADAQARAEMCSFADDRVDDAQRIAAIHLVLRRPMSEVMPQIQRLQSHAADLRSRSASTPAVRSAWASLQDDLMARLRFLAFARASASAEERAGLLDLADDLGWLTADEKRREWERLWRDMLAQPEVGLSDIALACARDARDALDTSQAPSVVAEDAGHTALLACLGSDAARQQVLSLLSSDDPERVSVAQAYLRQRPLLDPGEVLRVTRAIAQMPSAETQARAIEALGRSAPLKPDMLAVLMQVYEKTGSWHVQNAIAGVLIRADAQSLPRADWLQALERARLPAPDGEPLVDVLMRRWRQP